MSDAATNMSPEWIARVIKRNPWTKIMKDGVWTGEIRTPPCRWSFPNLLKPGKPTKQRPEGGYGLVMLFWPGTDMTLAQEERNRAAREKWPDAGKPGGPKLFNPIRDQDIDGKGQPGESDRYLGYQKGAWRISANSNRKVLVVNTSGAPIVDEDEIYPGCWGICSLRAGWFDVDGNKGPTFYLQTAMKIADDQNIAGTGQANPETAFAGVSIEANLNPTDMFGQSSTGATSSDDLYN